MSERIIVENQSRLNMAAALLRVLQVVEMGRISADGMAYCYATSWHDGVVVSATANKASDRFVVYNKAEEQDDDIE